MRFYIFLIILLGSFQALGQFGPAQQQYLMKENLLSNPGVEQGKVGWASGAGTLIATSAFGAPEGNNAACVTLSAQTLDVTISTTLKEGVLTGQGVALAEFRAAFPGVQMCATVAGVVQESTCTTATTSILNSWGNQSVAPFVFGATSHGIKFRTSGNVTGLFCADSAYVGRMPSTMSPEVAQAQLHTVAERTMTWSGTAVSRASFPDPGTPTYVVSGKALAPLTDVPAIRFPAGTYGERVCNFKFRPSSTTAGSGNLCNYYAFDGTNALDLTGMRPSSTAGYIDTQPLSFRLPAGTYAETTYEIQYEVQTTTCRADNVILSCVETPPASKIYSQANNEGAWVPFTPTGSWSTNTTYSGRYRKDGAYVEVQYFLTTAGAPTAAALNLNTPTVNGSPLVIDTANFGDPSVGNDTRIDSSGAVIDAGTAVWGTAFLQYASTTSFLVRTGNSAAQAVSVTQASPMTWASGDKLWLYARFPVVGWTTSQITGTFANVVTAPGISKPKTCYYAFGGAGSLSSQTTCSSSPCTEYYDSCGAISSIPRSALGDYTFAFAAGTFAASTFVSCDCVSNQGGVNDCHAYLTATSAANGSYSGAAYVTGITGVARDGIVVGYCTGQAP